MYRLLIVCIAVTLLTNCKKEEEAVFPPIVALKSTDDFTSNNDEIPVGGKIKFGIVATTGSAPITNLRITRIVNGQRIKEIDHGLFIKNRSLDTVHSFVKSSAEMELWEFFVMNANRDSAIITRTVLLGEGSAYGAISHYPSLKIGMQNNSQYPNFVDLHTGTLYSSGNISGHEAEIDIVAFVYQTSGIMSPTLCCPGYTGTSSAALHYPEISSWSVRNPISYDYYSSDNNLVDLQKFESAQNDSLLVASFKPGNISGLCKYCFTDKIIPFKTADGKYGLVRVKHADTVTDGYMELEIKIQQ
ncbi:MAG: hypothetical protein F9K37_01455 [Bacteroidales bacterium]|nr:MAG: hypothetical protein F9K37_01455 [Bacteroidales bacterium]